MAAEIEICYDDGPTEFWEKLQCLCRELDIPCQEVEGDDDTSIYFKVGK